LSYVHGCVIGPQREVKADGSGNEKNCSLDQYRTLQFLGRGAFGNVTLVSRMSTGCSVCKEELHAMKSVSKDAFSKYGVSWRIVEKEVFMSAAGHPFLVQLHSYFETKVLHGF
jgi:serine/threonine protein kinase